MKLKLLFLAVLISASVFGQNVPSYVPTNGLAGWWPFNGNANDESGNGNNGTVNGATLTTDRFGNAGKAYVFNGQSDFITVPDNSSLNITNQYSVSVWFSIPDYSPNPSTPNASGTVDNSRTLISKPYNPNSTNGSININFNPGGGGFINDTLIKSQPLGFTPAISNSVPTLNDWHHVIVTYQTPTMKLYVDGILNDSVNVTGTLATSTQNLFFGKGYVNAPYNWYRWFNGKLDDIGFWNRALMPQDVASLYNASTTSVPDINPYSSTGVFPNPSTDFVTLMSDQKDMGNRYKIMDTTGRTITTGIISSTSMTLDMSQYPGGMYLLSIGDGKGSIKICKH